jgi:hypothetical protein
MIKLLDPTGGGSGDGGIFTLSGISSSSRSSSSSGGSFEWLHSLLELNAE